MNIYITRFNLNKIKNGGDKYAEQIAKEYNIHKFEKIETQNLPTIDKKYFLKAITKLDLNYIRTYCCYKYQSLKQTSTEKHDYIALYLNLFLGYKKHKINQTTATYLVDDPIFSREFIKRLKKKNIRVIGIIHNIESFNRVVTKTNRSFISTLRKEMAAIKLCNEVVCISREEHLFLTNLNIKSRFLPYSTNQETKDFWEEISKKRILHKAEKEEYVILGSYSNPPTKEANLTLFNHIIKNQLHKSYSFHFVGNDIDRMESETNVKFPKEINTSSSIPDTELATILSNCKAAICFQLTGAGALTRISELKTAQIPILANPIALRSYDFNMQGTYIFQDLAEFNLVLKQFHNQPYNENDSKP